MRLKLRVKGQGEAGGRSRVKVEPLADTPVGEAEPPGLKGPVNQSRLFNILPSLLAPGIQPAVSLQPLCPPTGAR